MRTRHFADTQWFSLGWYLDIFFYSKTIVMVDTLESREKQISLHLANKSWHPVLQERQCWRNQSRVLKYRAPPILKNPCICIKLHSRWSPFLVCPRWVHLPNHIANLAIRPLIKPPERQRCHLFLQNDVYKSLRQFISLVEFLVYLPPWLGQI